MFVDDNDDDVAGAVAAGAGSVSTSDDFSVGEGFSLEAEVGESGNRALCRRGDSAAEAISACRLEVDRPACCVKAPSSRKDSPLDSGGGAALRNGAICCVLPKIPPKFMNRELRAG